MILMDNLKWIIVVSLLLCSFCVVSCCHATEYNYTDNNNTYYNEGVNVIVYQDDNDTVSLEKYNELQTEYENLNNSYESLNYCYDELDEEYKELSKANDKLKIKIYDTQEAYENSQQDFTDLLDDTTKIVESLKEKGLINDNDIKELKLKVFAIDYLYGA